MSLPMRCAGIAAVLALGGEGQDSSAIRLALAHDEQGLSAHTYSYDPARSPKYILYTNGTGVGVVDYDRDGRPDVFVANGNELDGSGFRTSHPQMLFRGAPGTSFEDAGRKARLTAITYGQGVSVGDVDADGWPDIYLTGFGSNLLFRNMGDGTFEEVGRGWGVDDASWGTSAMFADVNVDGLVDIFVTRYLDWRPEEAKSFRIAGLPVFGSPGGYPPLPDLLYLNAGDHFADVSGAWGLDTFARPGLGVVSVHTSTDHRPDFVVANDGAPNDYWKNQVGAFHNDGLFSGLSLGVDGENERGMGIDRGDYDRDGLVDVAVSNFEGETYALYRSIQSDLWMHRSYADGIGAATRRPLGFGAHFVDLDSDGWLDLFFANGHVFDNVEDFRPGTTYEQHDQVFRNDNGAYSLVPGALPEGVRHAGRASAEGDLDGDGDIDLVVTNVNGPVLLYQNVGPQQRRLVVRLTGTVSNRDGFGARLRVAHPDGPLLRWATAGGSFMAANEPAVHIGLGSVTSALTLVVEWPSGVVDTLEVPSGSAKLWVKEGRGVVATRPFD